MENTQNEEFLEWGAILDENTISEKDFILWNWDLEIEIQNIAPDSVEHFYNQAAQRRTRNGCTNYMWIWMISDLLWYKFSLEEILEIHDLAEKKYGWKEWSWNYLSKAIDCVRDYWNAKNPWQQIISFRVDLLSEQAQRLFDSWKTIGIWYRTTTEHAKDSQDNANLDSPSFKWYDIRWGHAIRFNKYENIDNYEGRKTHNVYWNKNLKDYVKENTYFRYGYVYFLKEESIFKDLPKNHPFYKRIKSLKDRGFINWYNDDTIRINETITRGEAFIVMDRICEEYDKKIEELKK